MCIRDRVTITSPSGQAITATGSTVNETITLDGAIYTAAAIFTVAEPGSYRVEVTKQVGDVRVAPRVTSIFGGAAWWFVAIALGGLLFVAGIITVIIYLLLRLFFLTERGTAMRAVGANSDMAEAQGINVWRATIGGIGLAGAAAIGVSEPAKALAAVLATPT